MGWCLNKQNNFTYCLRVFLTAQEMFSFTKVCSILMSQKAGKGVSLLSYSFFHTLLSKMKIERRKRREGSLFDAVLSRVVVLSTATAHAHYGHRDRSFPLPSLLPEIDSAL